MKRTRPQLLLLDYCWKKKETTTISSGDLLDISVGLTVDTDITVGLIVGKDEEEDDDDEEGDMNEDGDDDFDSDCSGRLEIRKKQRKNNVVIVDKVAERTLVDDEDSIVGDIAASYAEKEEEKEGDLTFMTVIGQLGERLKEERNLITEADVDGTGDQGAKETTMEEL